VAELAGGVARYILPLLLAKGARYSNFGQIVTLKAYLFSF
jgi:hypothetical protein